MLTVFGALHVSTPSTHILSTKIHLAVEPSQPKFLEQGIALARKFHRKIPPNRFNSLLILFSFTFRNKHLKKKKNEFETIIDHRIKQKCEIWERGKSFIISCINKYFSTNKWTKYELLINLDSFRSFYDLARTTYLGLFCSFSIHFVHLIYTHTSI